MAKPLRILFDAQRLFGNKTGVEYYTAGLVQSLADTYPQEVELVGYHSARPQGSDHSLPKAPNIAYRRVYVPAKLINLMRRLHCAPPVELLTLQRANFILYPNFLGLPSITGIPSAATIHDLTFVDLPQYVARRNLSDLRRFVPRQIKRSSFVITISENTKQRIVDEFHVAAARILVTPIPPIPMQLEDEARLPRDIPEHYILTIGTVEPRKNVSNVINAYLQLPPALQAAYGLVVVGREGWDAAAEISRLKELSQTANIRYLGYVSDAEKAALYAHATLFTSASHYEGFGMPLLEALDASVPCAISDIPVFHEVAGEAAVYFNQDDPVSISGAWKSLLEDQKLRRQLIRDGEKRVRSFTWPAVAKLVYDKILAATNRTA